jgi:uncharacterized protein YbgA (DUF1722 family)/uncharacterized protein YbbK (DUF523 family)
MPTLRVGVSSCLLGRPVRFDGGHKRHDFIVDTLGPYVEFVPVCPEVEFGLGTPRETMRLVRRAGDIRLVMANGDDHTDGLRAFSQKRVERLKDERLSGYILKKDSPSCGMERVKVYDGNGAPARSGQGVFAEALMARWPHLPIEEEGRLQDPRLRENFIERLFAWAELQDLFDGRWTVGQLVAFHTAHKLTLMAHTPEGYRSLGRLVADAKARPRADVKADYIAGFMGAMTMVATAKKHTNVLQHMVGYLRGRIETADRDELLGAIEDYRQEIVPLVVPITLIRHHVRRHTVDYLQGQTYLAPHPKELMLRNHV